VRFRLSALVAQVTIQGPAEAVHPVPARPGLRDPIPVHSLRWGPIRGHLVPASCRGSVPNPSYHPSQGPSTRRGTTAGKGQARPELRMRPNWPTPDRRRQRLLPWRCARSCSSGPGYPARIVLKRTACRAEPTAGKSNRGRSRCRSSRLAAAGFHVWQVGHQKTFRPSSSVVRIVVVHTRHGSPARR